MTIAVANAFMRPARSDEDVRQNLLSSMQHYGRLFPHTGYGGMFRRWLRSDAPSHTVVMLMALPCVFHLQRGCSVISTQTGTWPDYLQK